MSPDNPCLTVTILGSGTCVPSLNRSACSVLMEIGAEKILFDAGPGTMRRLLERGVTIFDISAIFFSHFHPDHTGELATFLFANNYPDKRRRRKPLTIAGGNGFHYFFSRLEEVYGDWIRLDPAFFNLVELDGVRGEDFHPDAFDLSFAPMAHRPESLAYRLTSRQGVSVVYSGDTDYTENLVALAKEADLLICESSLPDENKAPGHLTPSLAGKIASRAAVRKLVLTHFYPECDQADIIGQCRKTYTGPLILAEDLMRISFGQGPGSSPEKR